MKPEAEFSERLWGFAARVGKVIEALPDTRLGRHVVGQLVRCGTAAAPHYDEACSAENGEDAVHPLKAAAKEMRESLGWLRFIARAALLPEPKVSAIIAESEQLLKILSGFIRAAPPRRGPEESGPAKTRTEPPARHSPLAKLDHIAIVVPDTEAALQVWRDRLGFEVVLSEEVNGGAVRLTHLDLLTADLQLVEPLTPDHPLRTWLAEHGPGLHHFCLFVADLDEALQTSPVPAAGNPHQGTAGKRAVFLDKTATQGVQVELTGR